MAGQRWTACRGALLWPRSPRHEAIRPRGPGQETAGVTALEEELQTLEKKLRQLKIDYEHYFLGRQPREPTNLRADVQKQFARFAGQPIRNTATRFRFNSLNSRFQAHKRQWEVTLREIEAGTYKRHVFKANLREPGARTPAHSDPPVASTDVDTLFAAYRDAARSCGQNVEGLTPAKLEAAIAKQEAQLKDRLGCEKVDFRVVVSDGRVKLKASPHRS